MSINSDEARLGVYRTFNECYNNIIDLQEQRDDDENRYSYYTGEINKNARMLEAQLESIADYVEPSTANKMFKKALYLDFVEITDTIFTNRYINYDWDELKKYLQENPYCPEWIFQQHTDDYLGGYEELYAIANKSFCPNEILIPLAFNKDEKVRASLAINPKLPFNLFKILEKDKSLKVRNSLLKNTGYINGTFMNISVLNEAPDYILRDIAYSPIQSNEVRRYAANLLDLNQDFINSIGR